MRKLHQTMKAKIVVRATRVKPGSSASGRRQETQEAGSNPRPIEIKCTLRSKRPSACQWPSRSSTGLMSTLKYRYKIPPNRAETAYRITMVLAYEDDWTARNRPKNEPGLAVCGAHVASVW